MCRIPIYPVPTLAFIPIKLAISRQNAYFPLFSTFDITTPARLVRTVLQPSSGKETVFLRNFLHIFR
ncbi:hypothetical protein SAMN06265368_0143 [Cohaesibacter gelatinilyticus]|uniref:Uncharacterized protein n=1 Tax=Cohaesibacter gelatinilyticus TaxID=372072 RepID=A0A285N7T2_9HYPH|nr:hypothetical protein SAMN06265368_0143 [Cohaesibacter gelatinilyticus]